METWERPGNYVGGRFVAPQTPDGVLEIVSPADTADLVARHPWAAGDVERAIDSARGACKGWRRVGFEQRAALLRRYRERLRAHREDIALCIAREVGKPLWEARTEADALAAKVDVMLGPGAEPVRPEHIAELPGEVRHLPLGVMAIVGPFNFPAHLPNGQIVPALLLGNTVVHKPSEKAPSAAAWMARCLDEAGFPRGVFNLVQGPGEIAERLVSHEGVDGIFFTGSVQVGRRILQANVERPERLIALELGGKNASLVFDDCDLERSARHVAFSAYVSAGQRCTATSRVIVTEGIAERFIARLAEIARDIHIGYPLDEDVFSGPMISEAARTRLLDAQRDARRAGFTPVVEGGAFDVADHPGWYVRPAVHRAPSPDIHVPGYSHDELFGPDIAVYIVRDVEQAVALADDTRYGLVASVFSESRERFDQVAADLRVGVLHWNRPSAGASGRLPFGGIKASGNHRPAGISAALSCGYPLGILLPAKDGGLPSWPGLGLGAKQTLRDRASDGAQAGARPEEKPQE